ncbi:hypothetical protein FOZ63_026490, partial [Perkinsus olseni]
MVPRPFDDLNLELGDFENFIAVATPEKEQQESEQREQAETQEDVVEDGDDGKARIQDSLREQHLVDGDTEEQVAKDKSSSSTPTNQKKGFVVAKPPEDEAQHVSAIAYGYKGKGKAKG